MENLKKSLEQLHVELQNAKSIDGKSAELLQQLIKDIHSLLERSGEDISNEKYNILEGLKQSSQEFSASHPELSSAIRIVINSFSNIGA